jgi:hypothetical protein
VIAVALVALGSALGAIAPSVAVATTPLPPPSFLHVGPADGPGGLAQIVDSGGRAVLLKGVNAEGLVDYFRPDLMPPYPSDPASYSGVACPLDDMTVEGVDICQYDFSQLGPLGYDVIRLNISWSLLEPTPGRIDQIASRRSSPGRRKRASTSWSTCARMPGASSSIQRRATHA